MFVVFEGIDGSGKTTISNRVSTTLAAEGLTVKHLREGGKFVSPVSEGIREFGRNAQNLDLAWQAEFLLYVARDVQLIHEALKPALTENDLVLADRFLYTPEVLGRHGRRLPESFTRPILTAAADGLEPDLVILVDVDPTFARARRKLRKLGEQQAKPPSRKGLSGVGLQQRLRRGYLAMADEHPERWVVLENQGSLERSVQRAVDLIRQAHREGPARAIARFRQTSPRATSSQRPLSSPADALSAFLTVVDGLAEREPRVAAYMLGGMHGEHIDERRRALYEQAPDAVLAATDDLSDDVSFELRRRGRAQYPGLALRSMGLALQTPAGWQLWQELAELAPADALACLTGLDDERAWQARERYADAQPAFGQIVLGSLSGMGSARAWALRERLLEARSKELGVSYELSRVLAKSVTGLADDRSWQLRREARKLAPVAALSSLTGLTDAESWQWRAESLKKAPKVVMGTLKACFTDAAWQMRQEVVFDCKEALDGLQGVDSDAAWTLRAESRDIWPSTVVKTLGTLADAARGKELLERQMRAYPDNVSLLKHVSSIALGLHREQGASF
ncbi:MAG TPA: dTMP kinase [Polyangiaceae bacterium]|nr:dTMP kinase [Polyangiaceae bacterium]